MKQYLGVKIISAEPMNECEFLLKVKNDDSSDLREDRPGYKVVYEDGYVSWSPKGAFEKAYRPIDNLTFGLAIEALKQGKQVARKGWNGKGMWLFLDGRCCITGQNTVQILGDTYEKLPSICMKTADNKWLTGWLASQTDMLAEDWVIVDEE